MQSAAEKQAVNVLERHNHVNPGLARDRRNLGARAAAAERRARASGREGDRRRARLARELAEQAAHASAARQSDVHAGAQA
jgi:hypothetical protein